MKEFNAFLRCAKSAVKVLENFICLRICEYSLSHKHITFIRYDSLHHKAYLFSERDYRCAFIKCNEYFDYFAVIPYVIDGKAVMAIVGLELNVNGLLKPDYVVDVIQSKIEV